MLPLNSENQPLCYVTKGTVTSAGLVTTPPARLWLHPPRPSVASVFVPNMLKVQHQNHLSPHARTEGFYRRQPKQVFYATVKIIPVFNFSY